MAVFSVRSQKARFLVIKYMKMMQFLRFWISSLSVAVASAMEADGYNILCNNGKAAGQLVDHVHFHVIPRKKDDGVFAHWPAYKYEEGQAEVIAGKICEKL